jgi:hypothetical protein
MPLILGSVATTFDNETSYQEVYNNPQEVMDAALHEILGEVYVRPIVNRIINTQFTNRSEYGFLVHRTCNGEYVLFKEDMEPINSWFSYFWPTYRPIHIKYASIVYLPNNGDVTDDLIDFKEEITPLQTDGNNYLVSNGKVVQEVEKPVEIVIEEALSNSLLALPDVKTNYKTAADFTRSICVDRERVKRIITHDLHSELQNFFKKGSLRRVKKSVE